MKVIEIEWQQILEKSWDNILKTQGIKIIVRVIFKNIFYLKIYWNNIFYFLKFIFDINIFKTIWKH